MAAITHQALNYGNIASAKKQKRQFVDDVFKAAQKQHDIDFPSAVEERRRTQPYKNMVYADVIERQNHRQSPFLKLPREIRDSIYDYIFDGQVIEVVKVNGKLRLALAPTADPFGLPLHLAHTNDVNLFGLPMTCRTLHQEKRHLPYINATLRIITFNFISLMDNWKLPVGRYRGDFTSFLSSVPELKLVKRFEVVGVEGGSDGSEEMSVAGVKNFWADFDCRANWEKIIQRFQRDAEIAFRSVANIHQL